MEKNIDSVLIKKFEKDFAKGNKHVVAENAAQRNGIVNSAFSTSETRNLVNKFSVEVKDFGSVTNQKQSGRCWMFSGLNVLRTIVIKNMHIDDIELSESYLMFFDKLEKSNVELEGIIENIDEDPESRVFQFMLNNGGQEDGGYWHYFVELVKKYGVCPKEAMPETENSSKSSEMNDVLNSILGKDVAILKEKRAEGASIEDLRSLKEGMLEEIYTVLRISLGKPVDKFTFEYKEKPSDEDKKKKDTDKEKKNDFRRIESNPLDFFNKYVGTDLDNYVLLVNWPLKKYPYNECYVTKYMNNVVGGKPGVSLNVPISEMKEVLIKSLKDNNASWFACDVLAYSARKEGYLDTKIVDFDSLFGLKVNGNKEERLLYRASMCNHAMTFVGVNLDGKNKPNRWKVENSRGKDVGFDGIYLMSDPWFDEYVYEVVVNKKYITDEMAECLKKEPIEIEPWAPVNKKII